MNGAVSKVNKKFISHLTRAKHTPLAAIHIECRSDHMHLNDLPTVWNVRVHEQQGGRDGIIWSGNLTQNVMLWKGMWHDLVLLDTGHSGSAFLLPTAGTLWPDMLAVGWNVLQCCGVGRLTDEWHMWIRWWNVADLGCIKLLQEIYTLCCNFMKTHCLMQKHCQAKLVFHTCNAAWKNSQVSGEGTQIELFNFKLTETNVADRNSWMWTYKSAKYWGLVPGQKDFWCLTG